MTRKQNNEPLFSSEQIAASPDLLTSLDQDQLKSLWQHYYPRRLTPKTRSMLVHELAFYTQEKVYGQVNSETDLLIKHAIHNAKQHSVDGGENNHKPHKPRKTTLPSGSTLIRRWQGIDHKVIYQDKQYIYQGNNYKSLSKIANLITGTHWSGPRFFGLHKAHTKSQVIR